MNKFKQGYAKALDDVEKIIDERINNLVNVMHMIILQELKQEIARLEKK